MALWRKIMVAGVACVGVGLGLAARRGAARWDQTTARLAEELLLPRVASQEAGAVTLGDSGSLPAPVAAYLRRADTGLAFPERLITEGQIRARESDDGWSPFRATQDFSASQPGFVWDARLRMALGMPVRVRDAYVAGQGSSQVNLLSLVTAADEHGRAELTAGALHRYLAEAVWFPTALLPSANLTWSALDSSAALATLTDSGTTVSLEFHFSDAGEVIRIYTPGRYRAVDGAYTLTPWEGRFRRYEERGRMWIPTAADVEWHLPGKRFPVWEGAVVDVAYKFVR